MSPSPIGEVPSFRGSQARGQQFDVGESALPHPMLFRQILDELRREGLEAIDTVGEPFDPELHEAVATEEHADLPHQTITEELQRGYMLNSRLLRPALVKVSTKPGAHGADFLQREGF